MTLEQTALYEMASITLWAARRLSNKERRQFAVEAVVDQLAPVKDNHAELTKMYDYAKSVLETEDIR